MGVDLKLLFPWDNDVEWTERDIVYIGAILSLPRWSEAFEGLYGLPSRDLPGELYECQLVYDDENDTHHEHPVKEDKYGTPLGIYRAEDVANALRPFTGEALQDIGPTYVRREYPAPPEKPVTYNGFRAAVAYLDALPPNASVILYWC